MHAAELISRDLSLQLEYCAGVRAYESRMLCPYVCSRICFVSLQEHVLHKVVDEYIPVVRLVDLVAVCIPCH